MNETSRKYTMAQINELESHRMPLITDRGVYKAVRSVLEGVAMRGAELSYTVKKAAQVHGVSPTAVERHVRIMMPDNFFTRETRTEPESPPKKQRVRRHQPGKQKRQSPLKAAPVTAKVACWELALSKVPAKVPLSLKSWAVLGHEGSADRAAAARPRKLEAGDKPASAPESSERSKNKAGSSRGARGLFPEYSRIRRCRDRLGVDTALTSLLPLAIWMGAKAENFSGGYDKAQYWDDLEALQNLATKADDREVLRRIEAFGRSPDVPDSDCRYTRIGSLLDDLVDHIISRKAPQNRPPSHQSRSRSDYSSPRARA